MDEQTQALFNVALSLSEAQRSQLIRHLLQTLPPEAEGELDEELAAELDRRFTEWEEGKAEPVPWSELKTRE